MFVAVIISLMLSGILIGYLCRKRNMRFIHRIITVLIWLLLFLLGVEVGHNRAIIEGLRTIGLEALVITLAAVTGSVLASWMLWRYIAKNGRGRSK